jgi:hypothetical protein
MAAGEESYSTRKYKYDSVQEQEDGKEKSLHRQHR